MNDVEFERERKADDAWTGYRLVTLAVITLTISLSAIYVIARAAAPY